MSERLPESVVGFGAGLGLFVTYGVRSRYSIGPEGRWWEVLRRQLSRAGGVVDERLGPRPITEAEYAGTLDMPPVLAEEFLWTRGFVRNPFSRLKLLDGTPEFGSWVYRGSWASFRQLHLMLFPAEAARTHVYAHEEASSVNPLVGNDHFDGNGQNVADGVSWARAVLPLEIRKETPDPPDGPWSDALVEGDERFPVQ